MSTSRRDSGAGVEQPLPAASQKMLQRLKEIINRMSTSRRGSGAGVKQPLPAVSQKMLQRMKEIINRLEEEMNPDEVVDRLLCQDPFQEVKSKIEHKKKGKVITQPKFRGATNSSSQGRKSGADRHLGGHGACISRSPFQERSVNMEKKDPGPHKSLVSYEGFNRCREHQSLIDDALLGTGSKGSLLWQTNEMPHVSGHQPYLVHVPVQVSIADGVMRGKTNKKRSKVRRGKTNKKGSNAANASHNSVNFPTDDAPKIHQSELSSIPTKDELPSQEKIPPNATVVLDGKILEEKPTKNILKRLTAIELVRCKAVCKTWEYLISSSKFVSKHLKHSKSDPSSHHLLVYNGLIIDLNENIPGPFNSVACFTSFEVVIVGSVNGLICTAGQSLQFTTTADDIWILNPATGLSRQLPLPSKSRLTYETEAVLFAFWFDEVTDGGVYKVAKLVSEAEGPAVLEVWVSSSPDTWSDVTTLDFHFYPGIRFVRYCDVLLEGFGAYWIVADYQESIFVLWLDLKSLTLKSIPLCDEQTSCMPAAHSDLLEGIQSKVLFGAKLHGEFVLIQNRFTNDCMFYIWTMSMDGDKFGGWNLINGIIFNFPFDRCLAGSINGRLVLESYRCVLTLIDMENVLENFLGEDYELENFLGEDYELENIYLDSGHDFVGSLVSIEGFERNNLNDLYIGFSWPRDYPHGWGRTCKRKM